LALLKLTILLNQKFIYEKIYLIGLLFFIFAKKGFHKAHPITAGMKFNLNEDGSKYIRYCMEPNFVLLQMNPGTMIERTYFYRNRHWNRRLRFLSLPIRNYQRYMIVTHFGINNQTFTMEELQDPLNWWVWSRKKPGLFFHDAWNEYALFYRKDKKFSLTLGGGLHYYMGYQDEGRTKNAQRHRQLLVTVC
jgi:hypothetical protein